LHGVARLSELLPSLLEKLSEHDGAVLFRSQPRRVAARAFGGARENGSAAGLDRVVTRV
jgi:hypothetical protein